MLATPSDARAHQFPVSMKGVLLVNGHVPLLENERGEWELPGGKLEPGEDPRECLAREMEEELSVFVDVGPILDSWLYAVSPDVEVVIITYLCFPRATELNLEKSDKHKRMGRFSLGHLSELIMPEGYKRSIRHAYSLIGEQEK